MLKPSFIVPKLVAVVLFLVTPAYAAPVAIGQHEGITVVLTDEPCALDAVSNLQRRATWTEGGKTFEGCFGILGGMVVAYFSDKTVAAIPVQHFAPARGA